NGTIEELRTTERAQWQLSLAPGSEWTGAAAVGATDLGGGRWIVEAPDAQQAQVILKSAVKQATVVEFSQVRPTLTDLFRDVVTAPKEAARATCCCSPSGSSAISHCPRPTSSLQ